MIIVRGNVSVEKADRDKASDTRGRKKDRRGPTLRYVPGPHKSSKSYSYVGSLSLRSCSMLMPLFDRTSRRIINFSSSFQFLLVGRLVTISKVRPLIKEGIFFYIITC